MSCGILLMYGILFGNPGERPATNETVSQIQTSINQKAREIQNQSEKLSVLSSKLDELMKQMKADLSATGLSREERTKIADQYKEQINKIQIELERLK